LNELFSTHRLPVWSRLRPDSWEKFAFFSGLKEFREKFIRNPFSFILYGPPGAGKTTFIELLIKDPDVPMKSLSLGAASSSLAEIRKIMDSRSGTFILFMDELHRFSKARQDFFLKPLEEGRVILAGATTESPWYYFTRPLLSRVQLKEFIPPEPPLFKKIITDGLDSLLSGYGEKGQDGFPDAVMGMIVDYSYPDFRSAYLAMEHLLENLPIGENAAEPRATEHYKKTILSFFENNRIYNKNREKYSYELMSAFIKSIRGSDPDAAILYLAKMLDMDVDPAYIARRLVIAASEDIGLANSQAAVLTTSVLESVEKTGMPEARIMLAHAVIYLAASPKSNSAYLAINRAMDYVRDKTILPPLYIVNHSERIKDYRYPHDFGGFVPQNYWPEDLPKQNFYSPAETRFENSMENRIREILEKLHKEK